MPDSARIALDLIEKFGFKAEFDYEYPTPQRDERVQVRADEHSAPAESVAKYALAMKRGDKFAPIIVSSDGKIVDGNTRAQAALRNKHPYIAALVLDRAFANCEPAVLIRFHLLGAACNTRNGRGIDRDEIRKAIEIVIDDGDYSQERTAELLGIRTGTVKAIVAEREARKRADGLGVKVNGSIPVKQVQILGGASGKLNDEPFKAVLELTQDAGLGTKDVSALLREVHEAKTDEAKIAIINTEREARREQTAHFIASGKVRPPKSAKLRQALGHILKEYEENPSAAIEHNPTLVEAYLGLLKRARLTIMSIETAQMAPRLSV